jgi:hypothetical protein
MFKTIMLMGYQIEVSDLSLVWIAVRARECSQARQDSGQAPGKNLEACRLEPHVIVHRLKERRCQITRFAGLGE